MPEKQPQVSVLLPVFNGAPYLESCLNSIVDQTFSHFEVVAIDDGSTDGSCDMLRAFAQGDQRFTIHRFDQNRGIVPALNFGLSRCRAPWVARMDADDVMYPKRLEKQLTFMTSHANLDLIGCQVRLVRQHGDLTDGQKHYAAWSNQLLDDREIKDAMFVESPIMHPTFFARRAFFETIGRYRDRPWPEDYDLLLRAYQAQARFGKVPHCLLDKRDSPRRLYRRDPRGKPQGMFRAKAYFFDRIIDRDQTKKRLFIVGSGSSGRAVAQCLQSEGISVDGFVDHIDGPPQRRVMGLPAFNWTGKTGRAFVAQNPDIFFVACIGNRQGRRSLVALFYELGLRQHRDFIRFR